MKLDVSRSGQSTFINFNLVCFHPSPGLVFGSVSNRKTGCASVSAKINSQRILVGDWLRATECCQEGKKKKNWQFSCLPHTSFVVV